MLKLIYKPSCANARANRIAAYAPCPPFSACPTRVQLARLFLFSGADWRRHTGLARSGQRDHPGDDAREVGRRLKALAAASLRPEGAQPITLAISMHG
eukprot:6182325-Pleurochrysis_carterae.AAC.4